MPLILSPLFRSVVDPAIRASGVCSLYEENGKFSDHARLAAAMLGAATGFAGCLVLFLTRLAGLSRSHWAVLGLAFLAAMTLQRVPEICEQHYDALSMSRSPAG